MKNLFRNLDAMQRWLLLFVLCAVALLLWPAHARAQNVADDGVPACGLAQLVKPQSGVTTAPPSLWGAGWCRTGDFYTLQTAAVRMDLLTDAKRAQVLTAINSGDVPTLVAQRTYSMTSPEMKAALPTAVRASLWASKPVGPWTVAVNGSTADRPAYPILFDGAFKRATVADKTTRAPVGAQCNVTPIRFVEGSTTYGQLASSPNFVTVCRD